MVSVGPIVVPTLHSTNSIMGEWALAVTLWMSGGMDMTKHVNRLALSGVAAWVPRMVVVALLGAAACSWLPTRDRRPRCSDQKD